MQLSEDMIEAYSLGVPLDIICFLSEINVNTLSLGIRRKLTWARIERFKAVSEQVYKLALSNQSALLTNHWIKAAACQLEEDLVSIQSLNQASLESLTEQLDVSQLDDQALKDEINRLISI